ncbi:hypothetical protein [Endozoicomonas sp. Mp262]|uniref:hypothetical protein n=1 Tax=Endozoicomonas sp. Mp262 TaxID=2919499 RepID=UPI0021DB15A5
MKAFKTLFITVAGFLTFIGLVTVFAIKSCSSTVSHLVDQAFNIQQEVTVKKGAYYFKVPLIPKDYFIELSEPSLENFCINPDHPIIYRAAKGGEQCFNGTCRFYFNQQIPDMFEYLTKDEQEQCSVINQYTVKKSEVKKLYEISLLVPEKVSDLSQETIKITANQDSQFESHSHLSIGHRTRIDLEYSKPVTHDQLIVNGQLFYIEVVPMTR